MLAQGQEKESGRALREGARLEKTTKTQRRGPGLGSPLWAQSPWGSPGGALERG